MLAHDVQHLVLWGERFQQRGILYHGDTQEQTVIEGHEVKEVKQSGAGEQTSVEVVHRLVELVVIGVQVVLAFQELYLTGHPLALEHADGLLDGTLYAADGHVGIYDFLHASSDVLHHLVGNRLPRVQFTVETSAHTISDDELCRGVEVLHCFGQHKEERA